MMWMLCIAFLAIPCNNSWCQNKREKKKVFKIQIYSFKKDENGLILRNGSGDILSQRIRGKAYLTGLIDDALLIKSEGEISSYPVQQISKIKFKRKGNVGKGVAIGAGAAVLLTGVVAASGGGLGTVVAAFWGVILGPSAGAIIGASIGDTYLINGNLETYDHIRDELTKYIPAGDSIRS